MRSKIFEYLKKMQIESALAYFDGGNDSGSVTDVVLTGSDDLKVVLPEGDLFEMIEEFVWYTILGGYTGTPYKTGFVTFNVLKNKVYVTCARADSGMERSRFDGSFIGYSDFAEVPETQD